VESLPDVQAAAPAVPVSLSRVGLSEVEKVIRIGRPDARNSQLYAARLDCFVDLGPEQKGAHMSRFEEAVNDVIGEVILGEVALRAEKLARHIAERVRQRQDALRAEVTIAARYPEDTLDPVTGVATQKMYTLYASAVAFQHGTRQMVGVGAHGATTPRSAQQLLDGARDRLAADGFSNRQIDRILAAIPIAVDSERGLGTLHIGCPEHCDTDIDAADLLTIIEDSMSSGVAELLKRSAGRAVVENARPWPRFVEDCVREMLRAVLHRYGELPDGAFVLARQENLGGVHQRTVVAERSGLLGELRTERRGGVVTLRHTSRREWLDAVGAPPASDRTRP
jgi:GTP cyclohydrolase-4